MKDLELVHAEYFGIIRNNTVETIVKRDVTKILKEQISGKKTFRLHVKNKYLGGDLKCSHGYQKALYIKYLYNGKEFEETKEEFGWIEIPNKNNFSKSLIEEIFRSLLEIIIGLLGK